MKQSRWLVVAAVLLLAACQTPMMSGSNSGAERGFTATADAKPNRERVRVWVIDNTIVVDQEPIHFPAGFGGSRAVILWRLNGETPGLTFPDNGVGEFSSLPGFPPPQLVGCEIPADSGRQVFKCTFAKGGLPQRFKYTIRVLSNSLPLTKLDPTVMLD